MASIRSGLLPCALGLLAGCVPAGASGVQSGSQEAAWSPVATAEQIESYLGDASASVHQYVSDTLDAVECGYFASDGSYEAISYATKPDGTYTDDSIYKFHGGWTTRGSQLCITGSYTGPSGYLEPGPGCAVAEWSDERTLLLIDGRDEVMAEIVAFAGPSQYRDQMCGL